ncbi:FadR family transcriptional regulator [Qingshengfaniella alkalisoli]|uniref:FadR family transcriptional regulator n=2 Tax=Qingshengfaniella alkalisoli TaxID=2599296 RepID=A0A5B8IWX6_9RHOB|nr:FadR family transcriptional regulator [Qingshengfaniella alkalisoli]
MTVGRIPVPHFETRSPRRIHGEIAEFLGCHIVCGDYAPGDALPGEVSFCEDAGVSRSAYREAVRMVAAKGLIVSRPRTGTRVAPRENWNFLDPDMVRWFFQIDPPPDYFIEGLFELRAIMEPAAAELAALRRTDAHLETFEAALNGMKHHSRMSPEWREADQTFHRTLLEATGNDVLMSLASGICAAVNWTTDYKYRNLPEPRDPVGEHLDVYGCIVARDAEGARAIMTKLVRLALEDTSQASAFKSVTRDN